MCTSTACTTCAAETLIFTALRKSLTWQIAVTVKFWSKALQYNEPGFDTVRLTVTKVRPTLRSVIGRETTGFNCSFLSTKVRMANEADWERQLDRHVLIKPSAVLDPING